ncbi:hypothetical protein Y032_0625g797 [Ancylostoma ceylanicum]|uniref:Uncharacterized protein n=1 Tax=Ancylostoma ceylanicum TaxID=53326 RepID=A0A016WK43_9BILA|nr:hypothetical protein Y032_0625g797 [Ancylostoma ceylanicum]
MGFLLSLRVEANTILLWSTKLSVVRGGSFKITFRTAKSTLRSSFFTQRAGSMFLKFSKKGVLPCSVGQYKRLVDKFLAESD